MERNTRNEKKTEEKYQKENGEKRKIVGKIQLKPESRWDKKKKIEDN